MLERVQQQAVKMISGLRGQTYEDKLTRRGARKWDWKHWREKRGHGHGTDIQDNHWSTVDNVKKDTWFKMAAENTEKGDK